MLGRLREMFARVRRRVAEAKPAVTIGGEMAAALAFEKQHRAKHARAISPLGSASQGYSEGAGELTDVREEPVDVAITAFCATYASADDVTRGQLRDALTTEEFYTLLLFCKRASVLARRQHSTERLKAAFTAVAAVDTQRVDYRDVLVTLAILRHAAMELDQSFREWFESAAQIASRHQANLLRSFADRDAGSASLRAMGFTSVCGGGLIASGFDRYEPTCDLQGIVLDLAGMLRRDCYCATVTVADNLPDVWLRGVDDARLRELLKRVRGGAKATGYPRAMEGAAAAFQLIFLFVIELPSAADADKLLQLARKKANTPSDAVLQGFASGAVFCLLVTRTVVQGIAAVETAQSVQRFAEEIQKILARGASRQA